MKYIKYFSLLLILAFSLILSVNAENKTTYINLNSLQISFDNNNYENIKEYNSLKEFLNDYNNNNLPSVYITNFLFDGVSAVKTPDLDDFIDSDSNEVKIKTLEIKVINIINIGNYELTGEISGAMIAVNTNNLKGDINLILNNVNINTDSKKAPAIYVYNKDKNYTTCKVTIKTLANTSNIIEGGKLKKVSLLPSDKLSDYSSYYTSDSLTNYNKYSSYYGIYTSEEINNILFATVEADSEDLRDGDPYLFYKASGAVSSDIDLYFEGEGFLKVTSKNKEGVETKGNLSFIGGSGDYEIYAMDDCLNTTTSSNNKTNVRNDIVIDVNSLYAEVLEDADEGDAIDSNGKLTINSGTIIAIAHPTSMDAGLDSGNGTYINGGTILATGNMTDEISSESKQNFIYVNFKEQIGANTLITIKDDKDKIIMSYKTKRTINNLLYSSNANLSSYKIYKNGSITGEETNGLYTNISSYSDGEEISFNNVSNKIKQNSNSNILLKVLLIEISALLISIIIYIYFRKKE